jgi:hypothetical protein
VHKVGQDGQIMNLDIEQRVFQGSRQHCQMTMKPSQYEVQVYVQGLLEVETQNV